MLCLVFVNGQFAFAKANSYLENQAIQSTPKISANNLVVKVQVTQPQGLINQNLVINALADNCLITSSINNFNFVQDATPVNLNQPASCFALGFGKIKFTGSLSVQRLNTVLPRVVVELPKASVASQNIYPFSSPFEPLMPIMPILLFVAMTSFLIKFNSAQAAENSNQQYYHFFSLHELQILRC